MPDFIFLLVCVLASYRITRFFVKDSLMGLGSEQVWQDGEEVTEFYSQWGERLDAWAFEGGEPRSWTRGKIGDLLSCVFCAGFWVSCAVTATGTALTGGDWRFFPLVAFAVAGGQALLNANE